MAEAMKATIEHGRDIIFHAGGLRDALRALSQLAEGDLAGAKAGYVLVDATRKVIGEAVFPSLPPSFRDSIVNIGVCAPYVGTCIEAICTGNPVTCPDILADARFDHKWRDVCLRAGIKAVRSEPISNAESNAVEGTFVVAFQERASREQWDAALMANYATLASEAIRLYRTLGVAGRGFT